MDWLEFNIHIRNQLSSIPNLFDNATPILLDFLQPFVKRQQSKFSHWHYLLEPDVCRGKTYCEIRLRFEGEKTNLDKIKNKLVIKLKKYVDNTKLAMREDEHLGSHEGRHGNRGQIYEGERSENFGKDWNTIVEIMQIGSENALKILRLGRNLVEERSLKWGGRQQTYHPYYLHLPTNQLFVEP